MKKLVLLVIVTMMVPFRQPLAQEAAAVPTVEEILKRAEEAVSALKDYSGKMILEERFGKKFGRAETVFKFKKPFSVYIKYLKPHTGREAIFRRGWNNDKIKVHKGDFPDITLNLDPYGSTAMEDNHHPITDFGLENTIRISSSNLKKALGRGEGKFQVVDAGDIFGEPAWKIEAELPKGGYFITAGKKETLWDIARRTGQDMYLILYTNPKYDDPDDVDEGDKVFIPNYYGGKTEFIVSKTTWLPRRVCSWDWEGQPYECYHYPELKLNPGLSDKDFDPDNKEYKF